MLREEDKPFVLTIHGIRTEGEWQEASTPLLKPYYRPRAFKYPEYRGSVSAVVWLALQPLGGIVGLLLALFILLRWRPFRNWLDAVFALVSIAALWMASGLLASGRLERVAGKFATFWGETIEFRGAPHVVAHSLGTFITGTCLAKFEGIRAATVILNGCVLHKYSRWHDLRKAFRIRQVRNEIARKDWVSRLAYFLHGSIPRMGHAGVFGFHEPPYAHTWNDPHRVGWYCEDGCTCGIRNEGLAAFVYNVLHPELGHSDMFLGPSHAMTFWLPALWGIPSLPYVQFRDLCIECEKAERKKDPDLSNLEAKLRNTCWGWTEGPLEARIRKQLNSRLETSRPEEAKIDDLISLTVRNLWSAVAQAVERSGEENWAVNLHPEQALLNALEVTVANSNISAEDRSPAALTAKRG